MDLFADNALAMIAIPLVAVMGGRLWPYLVTLPIVALPIAGKTVRQLSYEETAVSTDCWLCDLLGVAARRGDGDGALASAATG